MRFNPHFTDEEIEEEFEGSEFNPDDPGEEHFVCDFCSKGVNYTSHPRVAHYVADDVINDTFEGSTQIPDYIHRERPLVPLATYCPNCSKKRLFFPCEGYAEAHIYFTLEKGKTMRDVEVTDISGRDNGIPWDPYEVSERITPHESWDLQKIMAEQEHLWGPENMVTHFLAVVGEVDIRELVKWDGTLENKKVGFARKQYQKFLEEQSAKGGGRKNFRDSVREENE